MKINLDYKARAEELGGIKYPQLTENYIIQAVQSAYPNGLEGQKRRIFGRLQRKMDEAIDSGQEEVQFEAAEIDLLKDAFRDGKFHPSAAKYVNVLEEEINKL